MIKNKNTKKLKKYQKKNKNYNVVNNNKTKKHIKINNNDNDNNKYIQKGGEVQALDDVDFSKFGVSKYINANINWGIMPGPPPMDCVIL